MNNNVYTHCLTALALGLAVAFTSCNKVESELPVDDGTLTIEFQQVDADNSTRTEFHENTIWWSEGDKVRLFQYASVNGVMKCVSTSYTFPSAKEILSTTVGSFNAPDDGTDSYYFSVYPYASHKSYDSSSGHARASITTPDTQEPTATGFDPAADLLISNYAKNLTKNDAGRYVVQLTFYRQVAIGKMRLINLPSTSPIASVEFSALHNESAVTLAGTKWYDFTTQGPTSVDTKKNKLTLDYSGKNITGDMTAYFCCYPFELGSGDSFTVKVVTEAGEVFTRKVTIPASRALSFEADRGTQFTVDMSSATKTDGRLVVKEYSSPTLTKTTYRVYFSVKSSVTNALSGAYKAVSEEAFAMIPDIGAYLDENGTVFTASNLNSLNSGKTLACSSSGLTGDTWNVVMCKLVLDDETELLAITYIKTDWFTMTATKRTSGGISYSYYGANLLDNSTLASRIIATNGLPEGTTFEEYYTNTLAPGPMSPATITTINSRAGATATTYPATKYYTDKTTQEAMTPGTNYTVMIKVVNKRGETKFVTASADAGGSTE